MTDRGLPIVDGAPACPFVAFEDDRDERATSPDHRHRCYAELRPAPRALAHQEAYCLSSAFPVCPTFQDWARREAARARAESARSAASGQSDDEPGRDDELPRRNPPRDWSAPPPWSGGPPVPLGTADEDEDPDAPDFLAGRTRPELGLAGSAADQVAIAGDGPGAASPQAWRPEVPADGGPGDRERAGAAAAPPWDVSARGSGGSAPPPTVDDLDEESEGDFEDDYEDVDPRRDDRDRRAERGGGPFGRDRRPRVGDSRGSRPVPETAAPSWERPRPYEAYPTLKTRVGLPSLSHVATGAVILAAAAAVLFLLPGLFLRPPSDGAGGGGSTASPSAGPSVSVEPTLPPAPTPFVYIVAPGDNLEKIRKKFRVTIDQILAVNPQITDPNKIAIGDRIVIPRPGDSASPAVGSAAP